MALRVVGKELQEGFICLPGLWMHSGQLVDLPLLVVDVSFLEMWVDFYDSLVALSRRGIFAHSVVSLC